MYECKSIKPRIIKTSLQTNPKPLLQKVEKSIEFKKKKNLKDSKTEDSEKKLVGNKWNSIFLLLELLGVSYVSIF